VGFRRGSFGLECRIAWKLASQRCCEKWHDCFVLVEGFRGAAVEFWIGKGSCCHSKGITSSRPNGTKFSKQSSMHAQLADTTFKPPAPHDPTSSP